MADKVLMHGPKFDGSGKIVEREVYADDVPAYVTAGYVHGPLEIQTVDEAVDVVAGKAETPAKKGKKK